MDRNPGSSGRCTRDTRANPERLQMHPTDLASCSATCSIQSPVPSMERGRIHPAVLHFITLRRRSSRLRTVSRGGTDSRSIRGVGPVPMERGYSFGSDEHLTHRRPHMGSKQTHNLGEWLVREGPLVHSEDTPTGCNRFIIHGYTFIGHEGLAGSCC